MRNSIIEKIRKYAKENPNYKESDNYEDDFFQELDNGEKEYIRNMEENKMTAWCDLLLEILD